MHSEAVSRARARIPATLDHAVEVAGLLANRTRLRILAALCPDEVDADPSLCVCDLSLVVGATETQTSQQLRALRLAGLVVQRREGRLVFYRIGKDAGMRSAVGGLVGAAMRGVHG